MTLGVSNLERFAQTQVIERTTPEQGGPAKTSKRISCRQRLADRRKWTSKKLLQRFTPVVSRGMLSRIVVQIACGHHHTLLLDDQNQVLAFGEGSHGQLGTGACNSLKEPVVLAAFGNAVNVAQLAAGARMSLARTSCGQVWSWGRGEHGELGRGEASPLALLPERVPDVPLMADMCAGAHHVLAIEFTRSALWAWGRNDFGQLGIRAFPDTSSSNNDDGSQINMNKNNINNNNSNNNSRDNNNNSSPNNNASHKNSGSSSSSSSSSAKKRSKERRVWVARRLTHTWQAPLRLVAAGDRHSALLTEAGDLWTWGRGRQGQLCRAQAGLADEESPGVVDQLRGEHVVQVACGEGHTALLTESHQVWVFGGVAYKRRDPSGEDREGLGMRLALSLAPGDAVVSIASGGVSLLLTTESGTAFHVECDRSGVAGPAGPLHGDNPSLYHGAEEEGAMLLPKMVLEPREEAAYLDDLVEDMMIKVDESGGHECKHAHVAWDASTVGSTPDGEQLEDALGNPIVNNIHAGRTPYFEADELPVRAQSPGAVARRTHDFSAALQRQQRRVAPTAASRRRVMFSRSQSAAGGAMTSREVKAKAHEGTASKWKDLLDQQGFTQETKNGNYVPARLLYDLQLFGRRLEDDNVVLEMRRCFFHFDYDNSGEIDAIEMYAALRSLGHWVSLRRVRKIIKKFDLNGNGSISLEEYLDYCYSEIVKSREKSWLMRKVFHRSVVGKTDPPPAMPSQFPPAKLLREHKQAKLYVLYRKRLKAPPRVFPDTYQRFAQSVLRECVELDVWGGMPEQLREQLSVPGSQPLFHIGELDLTDCGVTDGHVKALCAALVCAPMVRRIDLRHNKITAAGAALLAKTLLRHDELAEFQDCAQCVECGRMLAFADPGDPRTPGISCSCSPESHGGRVYQLPVYWLEHVVVEDAQTNMQRLASHKLMLALKLDELATALLEQPMRLAQLLPPTYHLPTVASVFDSATIFNEDGGPFSDIIFEKWCDSVVSVAVSEMRQTLANAVSAEVKVREIRRVFLETDKDSSGYLDMKELPRCLRKLGIKNPSRAIFAEIDKDGNGFVTLDEFEQFAMNLAGEDNVRLLGRKSTQHRPHKDGTIKAATQRKKLSLRSRRSSSASPQKGVSERQRDPVNPGNLDLDISDTDDKIEALAIDLRAFGKLLYGDFHCHAYSRHASNKLAEALRSKKQELFHIFRTFFHTAAPRTASDIESFAAAQVPAALLKLEDDFGWTVSTELWEATGGALQLYGTLLCDYYLGMNRQVRVAHVASGRHHAVLLSVRGLPWVRGFQDDGKTELLELWYERILQGIKSIENVSI